MNVVGACIQGTTARSSTSSGCSTRSYWTTWVECISTWVYIQTGGGSGGSGGSGNGNGTGGGSGTGGGGNPNKGGPPNCTPTVERGATFNENCLPGWEPGPPENMRQASGTINHHPAVIIQVIFYKYFLSRLVFGNGGFGDHSPCPAAERGGMLRKYFQL